MDWNKVQTLHKDIRFWIFLLFTLRLIGITNPPLEVAHNWRQTTVTMAARNFLEVDNTIFFPRIDIAGELSGITGMEFPLLNYAIYIVSTICGYDHWYGRLINLIITSFGLFFFYKTIKKITHKELAFWSTLILGTSIWYAYGRKIMPDTFAVSLAIMSVYYGLCYLHDLTNQFKNIVLFGLLLTLSVLAKLPAIVVFSFLIPSIFNTSISLKRKIFLITVALTCLIPSLWWYFIWVPYLVQEYGFWHFFMGKSISKGFDEITNEWPLALQNFYLFSIGISGFIPFLIGCLQLYKKKNPTIALILISGFALFSIIILKAGWTFIHHSYYMIPFIPFMALVASYCIINFPTSYKWGIFTTIFIACLITAAPQFNIKKSYAAIELLETLPSVSKKDLVVINSSNNPTPMYFAHKKGWITDNNTLSSTIYQKEIISKGCKYAIILKKSFGSNLSLPYYLEYETEYFKLYNLQIHTP